MEAVDISKYGIKKYSARFGDAAKPEISPEGKYLYEPANCLIKSGLVNSYANSLDLKTISKNGVYLLSDGPVNDFFGRIFMITDKLLFSKSRLLKYLNENNIRHANISKRNFPVSVAELRKLFKLKDGGEDYLFFTQDDNRQKLVYCCSKYI